jgi:hypothetical protein
MLRLLRDLLAIEVAEDHCVGDQVTAWTRGKFLVLDMTSEDDSGDWEYDPPGRLSAIVGVRTELAVGDLRPLYLAWLAGYGVWERDEDVFDRDEDHELKCRPPSTCDHRQRAVSGSGTTGTYASIDTDM